MKVVPAMTRDSVCVVSFLFAGAKISKCWPCAPDAWPFELLCRFKSLRSGVLFYRANIQPPRASLPTYPHTHTHRDIVIAIPAPPYTPMTKCSHLLACLTVLMSWKHHCLLSTLANENGSKRSVDDGIWSTVQQRAYQARIHDIELGGWFKRHLRLYCS